jgi:tRNA (cmo5U34)-methyltransferase
LDGRERSELTEEARPARGTETTSRGPRDQIFRDTAGRIQDFDFGARTAGVFDDMLRRSVPFYDEMQNMIEELAADFAVEGTAIYDFGCSTGTTLARLGRRLSDRSVRFVGLDYSSDMLIQAEKKLEEVGLIESVELRHADFNEAIRIEDASVALMVLTLQFVRPLRRERLLRSIWEGLVDGGCALIIEKVLSGNSNLNRLFIEHYYEMKRRHEYSDLEIARKREALENVLVPYRLDENIELLEKSGFRSVEVFFKWYTFCGIIAVK